MAETSLPWAGTTVGDAGPYTDDVWSDMYESLFQSNRATQGPLLGMLGQLAVTNPSGTTLRVASGYAIVDGKVYTNTTNIDLTGTVPGSGSNFYRIILRKNFTAQTVRVALLGPDAGAPPAVTQTDGTTWEISLYTVEIRSTAEVILTDTRVFCVFNSKIADGALTNSMLAANTIGPDKIADRVRQFLVIPDATHIYEGGAFIYDFSRRLWGEGWGWLSSLTGTTNYRSMFVLPNDYSSNLKISALWASHDSYNPASIALMYHIAYGSFTGSAPMVTVKRPGDYYEALIIPSLTGVEFSINSWGSPAPAKGDMFDMMIQRDAADPLDTTTSWITFWGFLVSYTADS